MGETHRPLASNVMNLNVGLTYSSETLLTLTPFKNLTKNKPTI